MTAWRCGLRIPIQSVYFHCTDTRSLGDAMKVTVYLPDALAEEARGAELSLSPICQRAIRAELDHLEAKRTATSDLDRVAARLRATIDEAEAAEYAEGIEDGRTWAREHATMTELEWITEDFEPGFGADFGGDSTILDFMGAKHGQVVVSQGHSDGPYWRGFIAGAGEVLDAVRPLL
jgi:post-segregation antitoxin (ccd killing protein)